MKLSGKESTCRCRSLGFDPWVGKIPWSTNSTPLFLPGESYGQGSLVGYSPWGHKESDMTEQLGTHPDISSQRGVNLTHTFLWINVTIYVKFNCHISKLYFSLWVPCPTGMTAVSPAPSSHPTFPPTPLRTQTVKARNSVKVEQEWNHNQPPQHLTAALCLQN